MDDEMEGWSNEECDPDYEFDVARFYDFSRSETCSEAEAAERWFESAGTYPPSPFRVKLRWSNHDLREDAEMSSKMDGREDMNSVTTETDHDTDVSALNRSYQAVNMKKDTNKREVSRAKEALKVETKPLVKSASPVSSTLMKPTASYLAKQNRSPGVCFSSFLRSESDRFSVRNHKTSLQNSPLSENRATKRQKLDAGYLQKVANLNHQTPLHHKLIKKVGHDIDLVLVKRNFTIPREFSLETARRAQRHRSENRVPSGKHAKSNSPVLKACQLPRKVNSATPFKKSTSGFQEVDVSSVSASENVMPEVNRSVSADAYNQNCNIISKHGTSANNKENYRREKHDPPVDLFEKLSLESKFELNSKTRSKGPTVTEVVSTHV